MTANVNKPSASHGAERRVKKGYKPARNHPWRIYEGKQEKRFIPKVDKMGLSV